MSLHYEEGWDGDEAREFYVCDDCGALDDLPDMDWENDSDQDYCGPCARRRKDNKCGE